MYQKKSFVITGKLVVHYSGVARAAVVTATASSGHSLPQDGVLSACGCTLPTMHLQKIVCYLEDSSSCDLRRVHSHFNFRFSLTIRMEKHTRRQTHTETNNTKRSTHIYR